MLRFELTSAAQRATQLRDQPCALFPGARGQVYRALAIGTRADAAATSHMLRHLPWPLIVIILVGVPGRGAWAGAVSSACRSVLMVGLPALALRCGRACS